MSVVIITGSAGLIGSEAAAHFAGMGMDVVGIDNDMRRVFFGEEASTTWKRRELEQQLGTRYTHVDADIRDAAAIDRVFAKYGSDLALVVHTAAQPSHDWAASDPVMDFTVNANGTLVMLEATRQHATEVPFIFTSTNKVYGDTPNRLPLVELEKRWEIDPSHTYAEGDPRGHVDRQHAAQRVRRLEGGGGRDGAGVRPLLRHAHRGLSRRLSHRAGPLGQRSCTAFSRTSCAARSPARRTRCSATRGSRCATTSTAPISSPCFSEFFRAPRSGEVYNMGGGRFSNCSMVEAIEAASASWDAS